MASRQIVKDERVGRCLSERVPSSGSAARRALGFRLIGPFGVYLAFRAFGCAYLIGFAARGGAQAEDAISFRADLSLGLDQLRSVLTGAVVLVSTSLVSDNSDVITHEIGLSQDLRRRSNEGRLVNDGPLDLLAQKPGIVLLRSISVVPATTAETIGPL